MNCKECKMLIMDYIYSELAEEHVKIFEAHIKKCKSCREEIAALQKTSSILQQWKDVDPKLNMVFVQERKSLMDPLRAAMRAGSGRSRKIGAGLAVGFATALLMLALFNTRISIREGNFAFSTGLFHRTASPVSEPNYITAAALTELQQSNFLLMQRLIQESEERQRQNLTNTLRELARNVDYNRNQDRALFGQGLEEVQVTTFRRLEMTDRKLNDFIQFLAQEGTPIKR